MEIASTMERDNLFRFDRIYPRELVVTPETSLPAKFFIQVDESEWLRVNGFTFAFINDTPSYKPQNNPLESFEIQIKDNAFNKTVVGDDQGETPNVNNPLPQIPVLRLKDVSPTYFGRIDLTNPRNRQIPNAVTKPYMVKRIFGPKALIEVDISNFRLGSGLAGFSGILRFALHTTAFRRSD